MGCVLGSKSPCIKIFLDFALWLVLVCSKNVLFSIVMSGSEA